MIGRIVMECIYWGVGFIILFLLMVITFGLSYEEVQAIFNFLGA
jgi:hypothetical protein